MSAGRLTITPLTGIPEVEEGDDVALLVAEAARRCGVALADGDVVVVSSKVVSKARGLRATGDREAVVAAESRRVVAERRTGERVTRVVVAAAGPVMAAAGVDASNTGVADGVLLLPVDPDAAARDLRAALLESSGAGRLGVVVSDTAGRPWRAGQVDFALGAAGLRVVDDLRGGIDADGRPLHVTARALADEVAAAADLVKGKADGIPAAVLRGLGDWLDEEGHGAGAATLVRTGREDWFDYGRAEAVRASLGVEPGSCAATEVGIASTQEEPRITRIRRAVAVAVHGLEDAGVALDLGADRVSVSADTDFELGIVVARLRVALWGEGVTAELLPHGDGAAAELVLADR